MDLIKSEKEKQEDTEDLQGEDFRILAEGFFWSELHIEIDRKEEELKFRRRRLGDRRMHTLWYSYDGKQSR
ncbi:MULTISPECIES: hypothetical protein [Paenibacillus]|jgi:hypothetical protein|uniref:Uncharacterized protein n=1 Tax=Paenibacillus polymyxa TaxID=1406 RepID=A0AAJ3MCL2_PAEPO|nr:MULTISPECIES: hypothetical protein [Paenibacillus]AIW40324.1 hypothetical protein X809_30240 [Paenibacillus polymyxa CR1]MDH2331828.1 hypothetical protein [Paenibacillus polymyxa]ODA05649.1 hypothetical protein A7312_18610 [Paenibacillus polymyxa]ODB61431.1 hypothetical protein A7309_15425 [Paenibacillus polymyxa]OME72934.1 hypothetical protein BK119_07775 [Paenibacillus peoriae]